MKSEFDKLVECDIAETNRQKDLEKVHKIALLEKEGKRPVTISGKNCKHGLFLEIDRRMRVHWETWENGGNFPARFLEVKKTEEI